MTPRKNKLPALQESNKTRWLEKCRGRGERTGECAYFAAWAVVGRDSSREEMRNEARHLRGMRGLRRGERERGARRQQAGAAACLTDQRGRRSALLCTVCRAVRTELEGEEERCVGWRRGAAAAIVAVHPFIQAWINLLYRLRALRYLLSPVQAESESDSWQDTPDPITSTINALYRG